MIKGSTTRSNALTNRLGGNFGLMPAHPWPQVTQRGQSLTSAIQARQRALPSEYPQLRPWCGADRSIDVIAHTARAPQ